MRDIQAEIRAILARHARLGADPATIAADADLYAAGMTSRSSVNVMLALEDAFEVEFPDQMLRRDVFQSITAIASYVETLFAARG